MRKVGLSGLAFCAPIALAACGDAAQDEAPPATDQLRAEAQSSEVTEETPATGGEDDLVVEVEPEIDAATPMDSAAPMADEFGDDEAVTGEGGGPDPY